MKKLWAMKKSPMLNRVLVRESAEILLPIEHVWPSSDGVLQLAANQRIKWIDRARSAQPAFAKQQDGIARLPQPTVAAQSLRRADKQIGLDVFRELALS
jgi:hypothetical protein